MSEDQNINPDELSDGFVMDNWLTIAQVAEMHNMSARGVIHAIERGDLIGKKIGGKFRGTWYVEPESAEKFKKSNRGRKP